MLRDDPARCGLAGEPGASGEFLPGGDVSAGGVEVAEDGVDGVVSQRQPQRSVGGVERGEYGGRGLGGVPGWTPALASIMCRVCPAVPA
jgi:hypothetical protein